MTSGFAARRPVRLALAAAALVLASAAAPACPLGGGPGGEGCADAAARLRHALDDADLAARMDRWGRSAPEVWHDVSRLDPGEQRELVRILDDAALGPAPWSLDQRAMYLVLVSLMRESRLFVGIVRFSGAR